MTRRKETECRDPLWLSSPQKAEIDQLLKDIEREARKEKKQNAKSS
jgi:predicted aldo/keto reductase-like oxidoreductase